MLFQEYVFDVTHHDVTERNSEMRNYQFCKFLLGKPSHK